MKDYSFLKEYVAKIALIHALEDTNYQKNLAADYVGLDIEDFEALAEHFEIDTSGYDAEVKECGQITFHGDVVITDPCYSHNVYFDNIFHCKPGRYNCQIAMSDEGDWGERVSQIMITHEDTCVDEDSIWMLASETGVDSGLAGFFENKPDDTSDWWDDFLGLCSEGEGWIHENDWSGFWSSTGFGDGCYDIFVIKEGDEVVAAKIVFIPIY